MQARAQSLTSGRPLCPQIRRVYRALCFFGRGSFDVWRLIPQLLAQLLHYMERRTLSCSHLRAVREAQFCVLSEQKALLERVAGVIVRMCMFALAGGITKDAYGEAPPPPAFWKHLCGENVERRCGHASGLRVILALGGNHWGPWETGPSEVILGLSGPSRTIWAFSGRRASRVKNGWILPSFFVACEF